MACTSSVILAIGGVFTRVLAKHSKSFSFIDCISVGVDRMQQSFESFWKPGSRSRSRPRGIDRLHEQRLCNDTELRASDVAANRGIDTIVAIVNLAAGDDSDGDNRIY